MKKLFLFLLPLTLALCVCLTAQAQGTTLTLPDNLFIQDIFQAKDGTLLINSADALYRASLETGEITEVLAWNQPSPSLCQTDMGDIYAVYGTPDTGELVFSLLKDGALAQQATRKLPYSPSVNKAACVGGMVCAVLWNDGGLELVTYSPATGETEEHGTFGTSGSIRGLFEDAGQLCTLLRSSDQTMLYRFDLETNKSTTEKLDIPENQTMDAYAKGTDGTYYALMNDWDTSEVTLQSGKTLHELSPVATVMRADGLVPLQGDCLLMDGSHLYSYRVMQDAKITLVVGGSSSDFNTAFTLDTGIAVKVAYPDVAEVLNTKNSDVDILIFSPEQAPTLRTIKDKGYFVDLNQSEILRGYAQRMYPAISRHLYTEDGQLAALIEYMEPLFFHCDGILDEYGLAEPATYGELLTQVQQLWDAGLFDEEYAPFEFLEYSRYGMVQEIMKRFLLEQEVLGVKVDFDNQELRAVLGQILAQVPRESPFPFGERMGIYGAFAYGDFPAPMEHPALGIGPSSPMAFEGQASVMMVNPYSKHQAEAIRYIEYMVQKNEAAHPELAAMVYELSEPLLNEEITRRLEEIDQQLKELEAQEPTAEIKDQIAELEYERDWRGKHPYLVSPEQLAFWKDAVQYLAIPEEELYSEQLDTLVKRLADDNMPLDDFIRECNKYMQMVYMERGE